MQIKKIIFSQFKGAENAEYTFNGNAVISGCNGSGKSTIYDGYEWVFTDKDSSLKSNPEVHNDNLSESEPTVEIITDIDDKEVSFLKRQLDARTKKQRESGAPIKIKNTFEINAVPVSQTDFESKLTEYGIDVKRFLLLTHPDIFMSQKSAECREILFGMVEDITDKEIAEQMDDCGDVAELLDSYTIEEITALQKRTKKSASERMDAIPEQIKGLEKAKVDIDEKFFSEKSIALQAQIDTAESDLRENPLESTDQLNEQIVIIGKKQIALNEDADRDRKAKWFEAYNKASELRNKLNVRQRELNDRSLEVETQLTRKQNAKHEYDALGEEFSKVKAETFDESKNVCFYCGQKLPQEDVEKNRKAFLKSQQDRKNEINAKAIKCRDIMREAQEKADSAEAGIPEIQSAIRELEKQIDEQESIIKIYETPVDATGTDAYKKLNEELDAVKQKIAERSQKETQRQEKLLRIKGMKDELRISQDALATIKVNENIDKKISELKIEQKEKAQAVADADKILYQLSLISMKKNELLTDQVNSHFSRVKFRLFKYLKNGDVVNDATPLVLTSDGEYRDATYSANTASIVLAKLDIISGLQKFYGQNLPVFLDGAECLDAENSEINTDFQLIQLRVTDDPKLVIK